MPQLILDPNTVIAPSYTLALFAAGQQPLVDAGLTHEQPATVLVNSWAANNAAEKQLWQEQTVADEQRMPDSALAAVEAANQCEEL